MLSWQQQQQKKMFIYILCFFITSPIGRHSESLCAFGILHILGFAFVHYLFAFTHVFIIVIDMKYTRTRSNTNNARLLDSYTYVSDGLILALTPTTIAFCHIASFVRWSVDSRLPSRFHRSCTISDSTMLPCRCVYRPPIPSSYCRCPVASHHPHKWFYVSCLFFSYNLNERLSLRMCTDFQ